VNAVIIIGGYSVYCYRMIGFRPPWRPMLLLLLAACFSGSLGWLLLQVSDANWMHWLGGVVYVLVFWCLTVMLNTWSPKDWSLLILLMQRKPNLFPKVLPWLIKRREIL